MIANSSVTTTVPLGQILITKGLITQAQLDEALARQKEYGGKLGQLLVELDHVTEVDIADALREQGRLASIRLSPRMVKPDVADTLGADLSWDHKAIALNRIAGITTVALDDPANEAIVNRLSEQLGTPVMPVYASPQEIQDCLDFYFPKGFEAPSGLENIVADRNDVAIRAGMEYSASLDTPDEIDTQPVVQLVQGIFEDALASRASDVHFEPRHDHFVVRFRVDGSLLERLTMPKFWLGPTMTRLKVLAKLDIAQRRLPQDGRIQLLVQDKRIDLRIATAPTLVGEGAVVRVLDGGRKVFTLDQLGMADEQLALLRRIAAARDGFILATGPTGAGKTTTLYSTLRELNTPDRKVVTLEDPVENELPEAFQINANSKAGLTFATGLRSVLRLDPDVIMVGEIRDYETARIAVQAALTGHLVLSTLATVGTAETITRLLDMGVERYLLSDTLRGILSQRLVKRICKNCRVKVKAQPRMLEAMKLPVDAGPFYEGRGCGQCLNTGFVGRLGVYEIMHMTADLYPLIARPTSAGDLHRAAVEGGMTTLADDGLRKVLAGETTLGEVFAIMRGNQDR